MEVLITGQLGFLAELAKLKFVPWRRGKMSFSAFFLLIPFIIAIFGRQKALN